MKNSFKRGLALLLVLALCLGFLPGLTLPASAASYIYNWGQRGETATSLSENAIDFYADNNTSYQELSALSGSSSTSSVPSSELYLALQELMESNHSTITSYEDNKSLMMYTDCQNGGGKISSFYSGTEVGPTWDGGWNREHTWPNSKGEGDGENDIMMLRPSTTSENSSRGNTAYGKSSGYYNPNKESGGTYDLRGDVSRIMLYVYVRWGNTSKMWGSSGVIESRAVLLEWMEEDPVDTWELGRNDAVESITGTRNVFVDYPELAFVLMGAEIPSDMTTPSGEAAKSAYTVSALSADETMGSVSIDGNVITAIAADGYTVDGYSVTAGSAKVTRNGNVFYVYPSSDCTVTVSFRALEQYTVSFADIDGIQAADDITDTEGSTVTLPVYAGTGYTGHTFVGWTDAAVKETADKPSYAAAGTSFALTGDATLYALYTWEYDGAAYYTTTTCDHDLVLTDYVASTCTSTGYTGDHVCAICQQTIFTGTVTGRLAHVYENGLCDCGAVEPQGYVLTDVADLTSAHKVIITVTTSDGTVYAMPNDGGASAPAAKVITLTDGGISGEDAAENLLWNISYDNGSLIITPDGDSTQWLYCIGQNNGVRIGTGENKIFVVDPASGYLKNSGNSRYLGVYTTKPDWRCYLSHTTQNIMNQTLGFYAMVDSSISGCSHEWQDATCLAPQTCPKCGATNGTNLEHNYVDGVCVNGCNGAEPVVVTEPKVGVAYKWGIDQTALNSILYFNGTMYSNGYYGATTTDYNAAVDVYLEAVDGGYYVTFNDVAGAKKYVNIITSGTYFNFSISDTASTVYTYNSEYNTLVAVVSGAEKYLGTSGTYSTFSVAGTDKLSITGNYPAHFYRLGEEESVDSDGFKATVPALEADADAVTGGGVLTWEEVPGATSYKVYRASSKSGSYKLLAEVEDTQLAVSVSATKTRYYKIKAVCDDGETAVNSKYSNYVRVKGTCAQPQIVAVYNKESNGKPYIDWDKVSGAKKYYVYKVNEDGSMTRLTSTTKTYYNHTKAVVGEEYTYVVRAIASSSSRSSIYSEEVTCLAACARPELDVDILSSTGKPELEWEPVKGAVSYNIYWSDYENPVEIVFGVTECAWVHEDAQVDTRYVYQVVAVAENEECNSAGSNMVQNVLVKCGKPVASAELVDKKPLITWGEVEGATKYYVYRATSKSGTYKKVATVEGEEYHDTKAKKGKTYYYKIVAVSEESQSSKSSYVKIKSR